MENNASAECFELKQLLLLPLVVIWTLFAAVGLRCGICRAGSVVGRKDV